MRTIGRLPVPVKSNTGPTLQIKMNRPQSIFLTMPQKFKAFVGGYGSGKTYVGSASIAQHFQQFPKVTAGYFGATYPQVRDIFYPTVEEAFVPWGFNVKISEGNKEVHAYRGKNYVGTIICRSMEKPETIIGFKIGHALVDEIDVMKPAKALIAWRKIIARMRYNIPGLLNRVDVTTTPEGFGFVYNQFVKAVQSNPILGATYGLIQASTYDNLNNLPEDYIPALLATYPPQLVEAYINGLFVNLKTGSLYSSYDRIKNGCNDSIMEDDRVLYIGMDFNVGKMAAVTHVLRNGLPRAVDEIINAYDTPDMIRIIKDRYWKFEDGRHKVSRQIRIYPDASGGNRKSVNASETDLKLLRDAGFHILAPAGNGPVKDRINSMNAMFCNALGVRRYKVNAGLCPVYADCLEQQAWADNGEPDKDSGHDHPNDAGGYYIEYEFGIARHVAGTSDMFTS